jgi:hypothetical protein
VGKRLVVGSLLVVFLCVALVNVFVVVIWLGITEGVIYGFWDISYEGHMFLVACVGKDICLV